ncbi:hypothetical protein AMTRI_Chr01g136230 [Amborella trichopoda]
MVGLQIFLLSSTWGRERCFFHVEIRRGRTSFTSGLWVLLSPQDVRERRTRRERNNSLEHFCGVWSDGWWISLLDERKFFRPQKCETLRCLGLNPRWFGAERGLERE